MKKHSFSPFCLGMLSMFIAFSCEKEPLLPGTKASVQALELPETAGTCFDEIPAQTMQVHNFETRVQAISGDAAAQPEILE